MGRFVAVMKFGSIAFAATSCMAMSTGVAQQQTASPIVEECTPPGGVWGSGNQYRGRIEKFADKTAVMQSQNYASPDKSRWLTYPPFPWSGGQYTSAIGIPVTVVPEGDGYKVSGKNYSAHFACVTVKATTTTPTR